MSKADTIELENYERQTECRATLDVAETSDRNPYGRDTPQRTGQQKVYPLIRRRRILARLRRVGLSVKPDIQTALFRHKDYPFPVVMVSIPDSELRTYIRQHIPVCDKPDYKKLLVAELSVSEYRAWHEHAVKEFL